MDPLLVVAVTAVATTDASVGTDATAGTDARAGAAAWCAAHRDSLTGLFNQRAFDELGLALLASAPAHRSLVAVLVDIHDVQSDVQSVDDEITPDQIVVALGRRFADYTTGFLAARLDGPGFGAIVASSVAADGTRYPDAQALSHILAAPIRICGRWARVKVSVGLVNVDGSVDQPAVRASAPSRRGSGRVCHQARVLSRRHQRAPRS